MENINYWGAVGAAWNRMKIILFKPFEIEKWFVMGFAAWIAGLNSGGGGGGGGNGANYTHSGSSHSATGNGHDELVHFWNEYGALIIMIVAIVATIALVLGIAFAWLHARGKFIFLDNVLHNRAAIVEPWKKYRKQGNSLFLWNLAIGFIGLFFVLATALLCVPLVLPMFSGDGMTEPGIVAIVLWVVLLIIYSIIISFVQMLVYDFVMPFMLKYDLRIREAWSRFHAILKPAFGKFVVYGLVRFLLNIAIGFAVLAAFLASCCCLLLIACIPYIGTVLLLPVYVFVRLIGLEFLRQFGENIDDIVESSTGEAPALP